MINYIQQLLPRLKQFSSQLDKQELFVDKLFTLLQSSVEVHQYTFIRGGKLILTKNGQGIEGSWELLPTGQLLINRGKNDIITLDFDFLHPDVIIMKLGGTVDKPFIIYRQENIENGNVLKYLKKIEAKQTGNRIFELPNFAYSSEEIESNILIELDGKPYSGKLKSDPYRYSGYTEKIIDVKIIENGNVINEYFETRHIYKGFLIVISQVSIISINIGDSIIDYEWSNVSQVKNSKIFIEDLKLNIFIDDNLKIIEIIKQNLAQGNSKKDNFLGKLIPTLITILAISSFLYFLWIVGTPKKTETEIDSTNYWAAEAIDTTYLKTPDSPNVVKKQINNL